MSQPPNHRQIAEIAAELAVLTAELQQSLAHKEHSESRRDKRRWRQKRYRERMKKKRNEKTKNDQKGEEKRNGASPTGPFWRGITYLDMSGKNPTEKKLNLSLLKRRDLPQFASCYDLHGEDLKDELSRITQINRDKSLKAAAEQRAKNLSK